MPTGNYWWRQHGFQIMAGTLIGVGIAGVALPQLTPIPFSGTVAGVSLSLIVIGTLILLLSGSSS